MRILLLTNFYPPARSGGYTQWCHEVAERLEQRGHTIGVLTSRYAQPKSPTREQNTYRLLHLEGDLEYYQPLQFFTSWKKNHQENLAILQQTIRHFDPDMVFVWGMWAMAKSLPALAESLLPRRVVYYLSDYWPSAMDMHTEYWRLPPRRWLVRPLKRLLSIIAMSILASAGRPALKFDRAICVSHRVRELLAEAGVPVQHARVIYGGTDVERFLGAGERVFRSGQLKLLYAGQLVQHKGVHTAIEAMGRLVHGRGLDQITLTLIGSGHPGYVAYLRDLVEREGLSNYVTFNPAVPKDKMPAVLYQFDALVFPSIYEEPLARMTQEALVASLPVVGTTTGGTAEILRENETGLTFAPEDADGLADQVSRLFMDVDLRRRLAQAGRQEALAKFTLDRMVDEIEAYLCECFAQSSPT